MIASLHPGDVVDRYEVLSVLGQGGMAIVLEVRHQELQTRHALKVLQIALPGLHERLLREGRMQAALMHPNVCHVSDVVRVGGVPGLVMELVAGPSLDTLVANYQPNLPQIDVLARGIVSGVRAAHAAGLVHRDLKPANVLVAVHDGRVVPKVADFGLAKAVDESLEDRGGATTRSGVTMGTPMYMAPEQFRDAKRADHRADLFSLGCILYELVSGVPAFSGDRPVDLFHLTSGGTFRPLREVAPAVPERIARAIARALEPDPARRWQSCDELLDCWCLGQNEAELQGAWEPAHLDSIRSLGPSTRPSTSTLSFAPAAATAEVPTGPTAVPLPSAMVTVIRTAAGLLGLGSMMAIATAVFGMVALGGILWARPGPTEVPPVQAPAPATVVPEPVPEPPSPSVVPLPAPVVPVPVVSPQPVADPTLARVRVEGVRRAWLVTATGKRYKPGVVPPGKYLVQAFFDEVIPTQAMSLELHAGEERVLRCDPAFKVCR